MRKHVFSRAIWTWVILATATLCGSCRGCSERDTTAVSPASGSRHQKGTVRVLIDVSNSFAPFDPLKAKQVETVLEALADHIVRNWPLSGVISVHPIDAASVKAAPLCPAIEYKSGGLLEGPTLDLPKRVAICAQLVQARSKAPANDSDIRDAINVAAASFLNQPNATRLIVVVSDFRDTDVQSATLDPLTGISVLMIYGPEKSVKNSNDYLGLIKDWQRQFSEAGALDVRALQLLSLTQGDVLSQLPDQAR